MKGKKRTSAKNNMVNQNIINTPPVKAEPKEEIVLQFGDQEVSMSAVSEKVRKSYAQSGSQKELREVTIYVKPEDRKAYYVINGETEGSVEL